MTIQPIESNTASPSSLQFWSDRTREMSEQLANLASGWDVGALGTEEVAQDLLDNGIAEAGDLGLAIRVLALDAWRQVHTERAVIRHAVGGAE